MARAAQKALTLVTPVHATRLANLKAIIKTRFEGNATACARALGRSHTYLWQLLNGYRAIGEASARMIESRLELGEWKLDEHRGMMKQSRTLTAHMGDGEMRNYHMVPRVDLTFIDPFTTPSTAADARPCPIGCSEKTVFFEITSESLEPHLRVGELAFADPQDRNLAHGKLFVVRLKKSGPWVVRVARKRDDGYALVTDRGSAQAQYNAAQVQIYGRVIHVMRDV